MRSSRCATRATRSTCSPSTSWPWSRWSRGRSPTSPRVVRRAAPFAALPESALHAVLDMLAGRYPSEEFGELRARITWDRVTDQLARPPRCAAAGRHLRRHDPRSRPVHRDDARRGRRRGLARRRAGRGDGLRVAGRRRDHARHVELAGRGHHARPRDRHPGARACRRGCRSGRASRSGGRWSWAGRSARSCGRWRRCPTRMPANGPCGAGSTPGRPTTCSPTCASSARPPGTCPSDRTILVERFRDELGDWRLVVHSPFGSKVNGPWALAIAARMRERRGVECHASAADDGIVLRLPDALDDSGAEVVPTAEDVLLDPAEVEQVVVAELGGSSLYAVAVPRVRGPRPAAPPARSAAAHAAVAAAAEARPSCSPWPGATSSSRSRSRRCASACRTSTTCPGCAR